MKKNEKRERLMPKEAKKFLMINSDTTLRKFEFLGLKVQRYRGSNRKFFFKDDLESFLGI